MILSTHAQQPNKPRLQSFFLNLSPSGKRINEKSLRRPAKIAPLKPPKEIQFKTCPRCAMQQILNDQPNL
jgi:hypothetical protein